MTQQQVFLLWHSAPNHDPIDEYDVDEKLLGVFANEADALAAIEKAKTQPGFRLWPDRFEIHPRKLGHWEWQEGFSRAMPDGSWLE
jgi:hypothetical protein